MKSLQQNSRQNIQCVINDEVKLEALFKNFVGIKRSVTYTRVPIWGRYAFSHVEI